MKSLTSTIYKITTAFIVALLFLTGVPIKPAYAADTGLQVPSANTNVGWATPQDAYASDNARAVADNGNDIVQYSNFNFPVIPAGAIINGVEVLVEGYHTGGGTPRQADISISWDNGATFTTGAGTGIKTTNMPGTTAAAEAVRTFGGPADTWNRTWAPGDFTNGNFRVRLDTNLGTSGTNLNIDRVQVRITYSLPSEINVQGNGISITDGSLVPTSADGTDFGNVAENFFVDRVFTIQNTGVGDLTLGAITFVGGDSGDFSLVSAPAATVAPGGSTTFTVRLTAGGGGGGTRDTTVNIVNNDSNENPYNFGIQGTRVNAEINVQGNAVNIADNDSTPAAADCTNFGSVLVGDFIDCIYTIQNLGPTVADVLSIGTVTIVGGNAADFSVTAIPTSPIANAGSTTFTVRFSPSAAGVRNTTISFINNDSGESPFNFSVQGTGLANTGPTTSGIGNVTVLENAANTSVGLGSSFADVEDSDTQLTYTVTGNTNTALFTSVTAPVPGDQFLVLDYALNINGVSDITIRATDTGGLFIETTFTVTVTQGPSFTSGNSTTFSLGLSDTVTVTAVGFPAPTISMTGSLPAGVTFTSATGVLAGTPAAGTVGIYPLTFTATNGIIPDATQNFTLTVKNGPIVVPNGINSVPDTGNGSISSNEIIKDTLGITKLKVQFDQDVYDDPTDITDYAKDATNPANYMLVMGSSTGVFQTVSCLGGVVAPDVAISVDSVAYSNGGGSGPFISTLNINGGNPLNVVGFYRLYVCGTTSIADAANINLELAGDGINPGTDFLLNFRIQTVVAAGGGGGGTNTATTTVATNAPLIPVTGFAPNRVTDLPAQPADKAYKSLGAIRIEIPTLGINYPIVGAMFDENTWNLTWLKDSVAYLEGSAYPTLGGNTVLTAHVMDANNNLGPFSDIKGMQKGQKIYIHANGQIYIYQVQENRKISPSNISAAFQHEEYSWITLVTCEDYNAKTGLYKYRRMVRAVLVSVISEK